MNLIRAVLYGAALGLLLGLGPTVVLNLIVSRPLLCPFTSCDVGPISSRTLR